MMTLRPQELAISGRVRPPPPLTACVGGSPVERFSPKETRMTRTNFAFRQLTASVMLSSLLGLAACGGGGGGGYGGGGGSNMPTGAAGSKAFAADSPHFAIGSLINPNPGPGTIIVDRIISGIYTQLSN